MFRRKKRGQFFSFLFIVISLFLIHRFVIPFSHIYTYTASAILYPVLLSQKYVVQPIKKFFQKRKTEQELRKLVCTLHKEKEKLIAQNTKLRATLSFHDQAEHVLDFTKRYQIDSCKLCHILTKHISEHAHFIYINKGASHGVKKDMIAVYNNMLLGRVVQAYPFYSKVLLITDKSCKVAAYCAKTKAHGIHTGKNNQIETQLNRVNHFEQVQEGDMVLSSGHGLVFPQGFALGKIVQAQSGQLYHDIMVKPLFSIQDIDYCLLIEKGNY